MYQPTSNVRVIKLLLCHTNGYVNQFVRPYTVSADYQKRNQLIDSLDPRRAITPASVTGTVAGFVKPSVEIDMTINNQIVNGWGSERLRWMLLLEVQQAHSVITQYLTGYTDHVGVSLMTQQLDPNMRFYINHSFQFRRDTYIGANGVPIYRLVPTNLNQLLTNQGYDRSQLYNSSMARPMDVLHQSGITNILDNINSNNVVYFDSVAQTNAAMSNVSNNNPTAYTARILDAQRKAYTDYETYGQSYDTIIETASNHVKEDVQRSDPFINVLLNSTRNTEMMGNDFSWGELVRVTQGQVEADGVTTVIVKDQAQQINTHGNMGMFDSYNSTDWDTPKYLQQAATMIKDCISAIMAETMFSSIGFSITNETGQWTNSFNGGTMFVQGIEPHDYYQRFIDRMLAECCFDLSFNNQLKFVLHAASDLVGDTRLILTVGDDYGEFISPTFSSHITAPVLVGSQASTAAISDSFYTIIQDVTEAYSNKLGAVNPNVYSETESLDRALSEYPTL